MSHNIKYALRWIMNTRGTKGDILCTSVQCATFLTDRPGRQFSFPNRPEKHKLVRGHWDFASCQVSSNSIQWFKRKKLKMFQPIRCQSGNLVYRSARKTQTWWKTLRSCFLSSFVEFRSAVSEKKSQMWKVNDKQTTDGQSVGRPTTCDHNSALEPSAQVHKKVLK